jgi:hypothetical protein
MQGGLLGAKSTHQALFDQLVGGGEQRLRHGDPESLGALEIDNEVEFNWLLNAMSAGLAPRSILSTTSAAR